MSFYVLHICIIYMGHRTTIGVEQKTLDRLKLLKITKRDTYDEIINRLIDKHEKS